MSYKRLLNNKKIIMIIICFLLLIGPHTDVIAQDGIIGVASRGHIQNIGDYPVDGSWVESPEIIGTVGQSKRIEGFEIKLDGSVPDGLEIRYNVHVQNKGWLYDETDIMQWPKNGEYAGTRGEGLRIEAVKIALVDSSGNQSSAYSVAYRGHVQNIGNLPLSNDDWYSDGQQLGTVGSSLRLEALQVKVVKTQSGLTSYQEMLNKIQGLHQADYTPSTWSNLQDALNSNQIDSNNSESEINQAFLAIQLAVNALLTRGELVTYNEPGIFSANSDNPKIESDVVIAADGVTLENMIIDGDLTIDENVGNGTVTLNNIVVLGDTYVRGGGPNSIHINGGQYSRIVMERTSSGQVRIVAKDVNGLRIVISEDAAGETVILVGEFESVIVDAPGMIVTSQGNTTIVSMVVTENGNGSSLNFDTQTKITNLDLLGQTDLRGQGTVENLDVAADGVTYERLPNYQHVEDNVGIPPVLVNQPNNGGGGGGYSPPAPIAVTGVSLNPVSLDLIYQETADLTATVEPATATNKEVSWSSSDDTVASVDTSGKITAVHAGTATITVTTVDGNKIATCAVTVHGKLSIYQKSDFMAGSPYNSVVLDIEGDTIGAVNVQAGDTGLTSSQSVMSGRVVVEFNNEAKPGTITLKGIQTGSGIDSSMVDITVLTPTDSLALTDYSGTTSTFSFTAQTGASLILLQKKAGTDADWSNATISPASLNENSTSVSALGLSADTVYTFRLLVYGGETPGASNVVTIQPVLGVTLNKTSTTLSVGDTETLTATFNPTNASSHAYSWSSDNASIASVDVNGLVTANHPGTANIIATTAAGSKTASCTVTVEAVSLAVTGISLDQESLDLVYQETADLTATVEPAVATNKGVSWSSSDDTIASVDINGKVTAVHAGMAIITVSTIDGNKIATCAVTVHGKLSLYAVSSFVAGTTSNYVTLYLEGDSFGSVYFEPGSTGLTCSPNFHDNIHYNADFFNEVKPGSLILKGINTASGIDTSIVTITVPTPTNSLASTACSETTAEFSFDAQTGATSVKLQQKADGETTWSDSTTGSLDANSNTATATNLSPGIQYSFRLMVIGGDTPGGSNIEIVTTPSAG
ncbi:Ig-like domain-containing protein [Eubacteriaceae bacterium ES2]|nr:Ig-like domain-containing protein [Eubacteriaceae bacterium ES2]